ncbi:hypothetical protein ECEC4402_5799, partial [Escherichia coli EC4402]
MLLVVGKKEKHINIMPVASS